MTTRATRLSGQVDPGVKPTFTACGRYQTDDSNDNIYVCANGINTGTFGYNNLQWYGGTYYHKFDENWHIAIEPGTCTRTMCRTSTARSTNIGGAPNPFYYMVNGPAMAQCPGNTQSDLHGARVVDRPI